MQSREIEASPLPFFTRDEPEHIGAAAGGGRGKRKNPVCFAHPNHTNLQAGIESNEVFIYEKRTCVAHAGGTRASDGAAALAKALALLADIVAQHGAEHEILGRRELAEWLVYEGLHCFKAQLVTEVKVDLLV